MKHTVKQLTLDNGAQGLIIHAPGVEVVRMLVEFRAGFELGDWQKYELPHVMEHMMFTNKTYPEPRQFSREIEKNGAFNNASTSDMSLEYEYECATFEVERIAELIGIQITEPTFPPTELKTELSNVADELNNDISDPGRAVVDNLRVAAFGVPSLQQRRDQLSAITDADLRRWFEYTHTAENMRFLLAGDIDFETKVLPYLNVDLPKSERLAVPHIETRSIDEPVIEHRDMPQIYYRCFSQYSAPMPYRELIAARIMSNVLSTGFMATLFGEARERGLVYDLGMSTGRDVYATDWHFGGPVSPDHAEEYFGLAAEKIREVQRGDISTEQLERTKRLMRGERARGYQKVGNLLSYYDMFFEDDRYEEFNEFYRLLDDIDVDEAAAAFNKLFQENIKGMSFIGNIDRESANRYQDILALLWQSVKE